MECWEYVWNSAAWDGKKKRWLISGKDYEESLTGYLNKMGKEGWELASSHCSQSELGNYVTHYFFFKRRVRLVEEQGYGSDESAD